MVSLPSRVSSIFRLGRSDEAIRRLINMMGSFPVPSSWPWCLYTSHSWCYINMPHTGCPKSKFDSWRSPLRFFDYLISSVPPVISPVISPFHLAHTFEFRSSTWLLVHVTKWKSEGTSDGRPIIKEIITATVAPQRQVWIASSEGRSVTRLRWILIPRTGNPVVQTSYRNPRNGSHWKVRDFSVVQNLV